MRKTSKTNMSIDIKVTTKFLADQTEETEQRFVFAYTITITNNREQPWQLLNRYWLITDADGKKTEVKGAGVVGEQPVIQPGKQYSYTSGCILKTPIGTMEGFYEMKSDSGETEQVAIPVFRLAVKNILH